MTIDEHRRRQVIRDWLEGESAAQISKDRGISRSEVYIIIKECPKDELAACVIDHIRKRQLPIDNVAAGFRLQSVQEKLFGNDLIQAERATTLYEKWTETALVEGYDPKQVMEANMAVSEAARKMGVTVFEMPQTLQNKLEEIEAEFVARADVKKETADIRKQNEIALKQKGLIEEYLQTTKHLVDELAKRGRRLSDIPKLLDILDATVAARVSLEKVLPYLSNLDGLHNMQYHLERKIAELDATSRFHLDRLMSISEHSKSAASLHEVDMGEEEVALLKEAILKKAKRKGITFRQAFQEIIKPCKDDRDDPMLRTLSQSVEAITRPPPVIQYKIPAPRSASSGETSTTAASSLPSTKLEQEPSGKLTPTIPPKGPSTELGGSSSATSTKSKRMASCPPSVSTSTVTPTRLFFIPSNENPYLGRFESAPIVKRKVPTSSHPPTAPTSGLFRNILDSK